MEIKDIFI